MAKNLEGIEEEILEAQRKLANSKNDEARLTWTRRIGVLEAKKKLMRAYLGMNDGGSTPKEG